MKNFEVARKLMILSLFALVLSACQVSIDSNPINSPTTSQSGDIPATPVVSNGPPPPSNEYLNAEEVTTSNNYRIRASFGELSQEVVLQNGYVINGVVQ